MAVWAALGRAATEQVLFRSGAVLERLAQVDAVCFDKTGTLTSGSLEVNRLLVLHGDNVQAVLANAARLASGSTHAAARAIDAFAERRLMAALDAPIASWQADRVQTYPGRGVAAEVGNEDDGAAVAYLGSAQWMAERKQAIPEELARRLRRFGSTANSLACVAWDDRVRGVFFFTEQLRPDAQSAVAACRALGLQTMMLTGDRCDSAAAIARELGLNAIGEQLPHNKAQVVKGLGGHTAMVGDGINDAPALANAHVGVALGCGADISRDAAGVCILGDQLTRIPWAVGLARHTTRVVRQNLFWAFAYNVAGIMLAAAGKLNPIWAAGAMAVSSVLVIANSLRLSKYEDPPAPTAPILDAHDGLSTSEDEARSPSIGASIVVPELAGAGR
jgi:cation transport ATPase